jgi:hypothetical protein
VSPRVPQLRTSPPYRGGLRRCHVSHGSGLCLPERRALALPRVPQLRTSPPCRCELRRCHVSHGSGFCLPERRAPTLPCVLQLWASPPYRGGLRRCHVAPTSPPREESSGAVTYPTVPSGLCTKRIKNDLTAPGRQLGSHVFKARLCVTEAPVRRADIPLQFGSTAQRSSS